ncbi:hypothetical protein WPS_29550 [Vulcanimicrobium alpinum]|uniref:Uncharacterized protein n=1 Tax=Vulcanimicrobium alpinum TaxID=3016050 RepID=A0AAN2CAT0_UNVUL|nr:hypothetical protein [Vulcanimicrobium alpinum]BDE07679.1 hypothetical protein WPS_29550 [Vulcanimicrobium alpinum]
MIRRIAAFAALTVLAGMLVPAGAQQGSVVRFTGQLLDVRNGFVYFTTGAAFKLAPNVAYDDYDTGQPTSLAPQPKLFARAIVDPATKQVVELDLTRKRLATDAAYAPDVQAAVATKPTTEPAPEIVGVRVTGKEVPVEFVVTVPASTRVTDNVYLSTDASGWNPQAIKLDRIDGQRYRIVRRLPSGTKFVFRVTRGTWNSVEVGQDGLEPANPHVFFIKEADSLSQPVTVYGWSDNRAGVPQAAAPGAVPTPFNPNPFPNGGIAPPSRATPPGGFPTQRPNPFPNRPPG